MSLVAARPDVDAIVVGGGVAGCEAAWSAAGSGLKTLLITTSLDSLYQLAHDETALQPPPGTLLEELVAGDGAGRIRAASLRRAAKARLESLPTLHLLQSTVSGLVTVGGELVGVRTWEGSDRRGRQVALCVGGFLRARLHVGSVVEQQGRLSEMAYDDLYDDLARRGFGFVDIELAAPQVAGALPYLVRSVALAASERDPSGTMGEAIAGAAPLHRLPRLWAAGVCAPRSGAALPGYEAAAAEGLALGRALAASSS